MREEDIGSGCGASSKVPAAENGAPTADDQDRRNGLSDAYVGPSDDERFPNQVSVYSRRRSTAFSGEENRAYTQPQRTQRKARVHLVAVPVIVGRHRKVSTE